jgi:RNA polymerase sigma factor (sigma-70 family)
VNEVEPALESVTVERRALGSPALDMLLTAAYEAHSAAVYGLALRSTRSPELAADVTQEAFIRLLTEGQRGRYPDNVGGWLYRTSSNLIISGARRRSVARRLARRLVPPAEPEGPETVALERERKRELDAALASLSVIDRLVVVMAAQGASGERSRITSDDRARPREPSSVAPAFDSAGTIKSWCAPPQPCVSAPPDSYWVTFTASIGWESIPVYGDGGDGWLLGVPVAPDGPPGSDGASQSP